MNFNGTGVVSIRASGNVSSITDNGTGNYSVNFTTTMADANYCAHVTATHPGGAGTSLYGTVDKTSANSSSAFKLFTLSNTNAQVDCAEVFASVVR